MSPPPESWSVRMNKVVVTGGSRGLGLGIARRLVEAGYEVIAIARRQSSDFNAAAAQANADAPLLHFVPFDLSDIAKIPELAKQLRKQFGAVYGLVNNAGSGTSGMLATMSATKIEELVRLNTISPMVLTKHLVRSMMTHGGGRIVNVSSITGFTGYSGLSVYSATKASMIGFTKSLAREVGQLGINVNAVAPGFVDTEMTSELGTEHRSTLARRSALRRLPEVIDVANAVEFLLGDKSRNITGTVLTVDAGSTA
jgi:3-oxoacyl-[acyl-carrier protein] reductase